MLLVLTMSGCSLTDKLNEAKATGKTTKSTPKDIKSEDGKVQLTIPKDWEELSELKQVNEKICLGVGNKYKEKYGQVISESKEDFSKDITLDEYNNIIVEQVRAQISNGEFSKCKDIEINGYKAKIFEIKGEVSKVKVAYLYAIIDAPNSFNQVITWSLQSKYEQNKEELNKVIQSFKEVSK